MDPNSQNNQPTQPGQGIQPNSNPAANQNPTSQAPLGPAPDYSYSSGGGSNKTKKILIILGGLILIFVILVIVVALRGNGNDQNNSNDQSDASGEFYVKEPTAVDIENVGNSIADDLSGLDTEVDFPKDNLSDDNLDL